MNILPSFSKKKELSNEEIENEEIESLKQKARTGMEFICREANKPRIAEAAVTMLNDKYYYGLQAAAEKIAIPDYTAIMGELKQEINRLHPPPAPGPAGVPGPGAGVLGPGGGGGRRRTKKSKYYNKRKRTKRRRTKRRRSNKRRN